ncbi:AAA family ATPase [Caedibacter taeniospiralis]|uniref:AAA family ATPase n=1 Tax=Caedibacter taeniospiralis TaxID=28907 RepID=UPI000C278651|nr:AAA family ATPase [Caedibacter taeniospiralis]
MKKLPIGISGLAEMVTNDYLYVDKTKHFYHLTENGNYYFLSRPRCFGKSLLNVSVLF